MVQSRHGEGAKIVLSTPHASFDVGQALDADIFSDAAGFSTRRIRLIARDNCLQAEEPFESATASFTGLSTYSGYQRLADAEDDNRTTALLALAQAFVGSASDGPPSSAPLPSVYTYFGQFIAHEISKLSLLSDGSCLNLNTSRYDLDTLVYAPGKAAQAVQQFAPKCVSFGLAALGNTAPAEVDNPYDLPRTRGGEPVVPDGRCDANLALAQIHVAILRRYRALLMSYSNEQAALDDLRAQLHAITFRDYLSETIDECVYNDVRCNGRCLVNPHQTPLTHFLTPIEFAVGAFRFGHAMVRTAYKWSNAGTQPFELVELLRRTQAGGGLYLDGPDAVRRLPHDWIMDFSDMGSGPCGSPNLASRISPALSVGLQSIEQQFVPGAETLNVNLAEKTLRRGQQVRLPSAQSLWKKIEIPCGRRLTPGEVAGPSDGRFFSALTMTDGGDPTLAEETPLWFYVLREAEVFHAGRKLGPLGGRIVMETVHAAMASAGTDIAALPHMTLNDFFDPAWI